MTPAQLGIIIALLATVLLGATGALVYRLAQQTSQPAREAISVSPTQTPSPLVPPSSNDATVPADWKTYIDQTHHYSLKYPDSWGKGSVCDGDAEKNLVRFGADLLQFPDSNCGTANIPSMVYFYVDSTPPFLYPNYKVIEEKTIPINGKTGQYYEFNIIDRKLVGSNRYFQVSVPIGNLYLIGQTGAYESPTLKNVFETIISSIKFPVSDPEKFLIDSWLQQNNLNQYGDSKDRVYAGGTPLFDERTGERTDLYDYIVKKFPERPWND